MTRLLKTAQEMLEMAYEAEDGHFEQTLFDGRIVCVTDYNETLLLKDFRKTTTIWSEAHISFEELRQVINESNDALIDAGLAA